MGSVSQEGGTTVALRPKVRTASKRLTKAECRAICRHYRQRRNQPLMGLTASMTLGGADGLQAELWKHVSEVGSLPLQELEVALEGLVPTGYVLAAASGDDRLRAVAEAESEAEREEEEAEVARIAAELELQAEAEGVTQSAAPMDVDSTTSGIF